MHQFVKMLLQEFEKNANPQRALEMSAYMKHIDEFHGIPSPQRKQFAKDVLNSYGKDALLDWQEINLALMNKGKREGMYSAIEFAEKAHKHWEEDAIVFLTKLILHRSWWDSVDAIAPLIGIYFEKFPEKRDAYIAQWMESGNFWLWRICLLFQKRYKKDTDEQLLYALSLKLAGEKEFFIRKGMGWALREYSYVNPESVRDFVEKYPLSALTKKEALKAINRRNHS
jgi:3-methyladenine DNA glycosylase AlkD